MPSSRSSEGPVHVALVQEGAPLCRGTRVALVRPFREIWPGRSRPRDRALRRDVERDGGCRTPRLGRQVPPYAWAAFDRREIRRLSRRREVPGVLGAGVGRPRHRGTCSDGGIAHRQAVGLARPFQLVSEPPAADRVANTVRFYELLSGLAAGLGGCRRLAECHGRMDWPQRGVYFFFEPGELRSLSGTGNRVVRVGTHALTDGSRSTLWQRLSQHRGNAKGNGGNHRGSIFRLLLGAALARRGDCPLPSSWSASTSGRCRSCGWTCPTP